MDRTQAAQTLNERTGGTWAQAQIDDALDALRDGLLSKISLGTSHGWLLSNARDGYVVTGRAALSAIIITSAKAYKDGTGYVIDAAGLHTACTGPQAIEAGKLLDGGWTVQGRTDRTGNLLTIAGV